MKASAITTILVVEDISASRSFYVDALGATVYREYGGDSLVLEFLGAWLLLVTPGGPTEDKPHVDFVVPDDRQRVSHSFTIRVENCQEAYRELLAKGVEFITPPVVNGAETRCFFYDPDGHLLEISEYRAS